MRPLLCCLILVQLAASEPSNVYRLEIPDLLPDHRVIVTLMHRAGRFHQAYAQIPGRDNLVHDADPAPAQPIQFALTDGTPVEVPAKLRDRYAYKDPDFERHFERYRAGELHIVHPTPVAPLAVAADGSLSGHLDLMIYETDVTNTGGWQDDALVYRLSITASLAADGVIIGCGNAWRYQKGDYDYGAEQPRQAVRIIGRRQDRHWQPAPEDAFAPGKDWPQVYGPFGTGSAIDCDRELIGDLRDARLVWVAEERIGGGRGGGSRRGGFAMYPQPWSGLGYGGYATPVVVDGKVYLHHMFADAEVIRTRMGIERDPFLRLGNPIESLANDYDAYRDAVLCLDARTGQTLWHWKGDATFGDIPASKSGRGTTAVVAGGKVYAVGHGALYCLNAADGSLVWTASGADIPPAPAVAVGRSTKEKRPQIRFGAGGGSDDNWSKEMSPALVGGTIILIRDGHAVGVDPKDGSLRWVVRDAAGGGAVAQRIAIDGRELLICQGEVVLPSKAQLKADPGRKPTPEDLLLIDPITGAVLVRSQALGATNMQPLVWDDLVVANGVRGIVDPTASKGKAAGPLKERVAAARMTLTAAERLWQQDAVHFPTFRSTPVAHRGVAYIDSRETGFSAVDIRTGAVLGRQPNIHAIAFGDHNWTWTVASNNRIITNGLLMFTTADEGFRLLPGRLGLPVAQGYMCPVKPALADGRLILRTERSIVCYDLRARPETRGTRILKLKAEHAVPGLGADRDGGVTIMLRERGGRLLDISGEIPPVLSSDRLGLPDWLGERRGAQYRSSSAARISLDAAGLHGNAVVRLAENHESWSFDLKPEDNGFAGTYTRRATPLAKPIPVTPGVGGQYHARPDGSGGAWALYLGRCIGGPDALSNGSPDQALSVLVRVDAAGTVVGGLAASGRTNTQPWELDPGDLAVVDGRLRGSCTVLVRDDEFLDIHFERAREQLRLAADGGTLAIALTIDAGAANGQLNGSASGIIGVPWERKGRISGTWDKP